jgi:hypothetical protein
MKRQRGRGRKPGGGHHHNNQHHHPNRTMESNGPDTKVRGPAAHIFERYLQLARDAASSGDRVLSENYLQHADHYFRLVRSMQPATPPQQANERFGDGAEAEGDEDVGGEADGGEGEGGGGESGDQPDVEFPQGQQAQQFDREGGGEFRRRRGRRNRFRPEGEREGGVEGREGEERGEPRERAESERDGGRRERGGREQAGPEGFSSGPKPAFLRGGE